MTSQILHTRTKVWSLRSRLRSARRGAVVPVAVWATLLRLGVLVVGWLLTMASVRIVIPMTAGWLHGVSGASRTTLSIDGTIVLLLMPLLFVVILLAAGEITVLRALWRGSTRRIQRIRDLRAERGDR